MERDIKPEKFCSVNLGCGKDTSNSHINVDIVKSPGVDKVHNLNIYPYPFKESSVNLVIMKHVLEHLDDVIKTMDEIHRILKPGGLVEITVPYYKHRNAFSDPTHKHFFTKRTMDYFLVHSDKMKIDWYTKHKFNVVKFYKYNNGFPCWHLKKYLNIQLMLPIFADTLYWRLEVVK